MTVGVADDPALRRDSFDAFFDLDDRFPAAVTITRTSEEDFGSRQLVVSIDGAPVAELLWGDSITRDLLRVLAESQDATGRSGEIVEVPAPQVLRDPIEGGEVDWVDYSYVNHLVVNGGVIACGFGDDHDEKARAILAEEYAGREVVTVEARPIFARGGGIHCITQQQPALP